MPDPGRGVTASVTESHAARCRGHVLAGLFADFERAPRLARPCIGVGCHGARNGCRRAAGGDRGVHHDRGPAAPPCRARASPSLLPLRRDLDASGAVHRGARATLSLVPRRQPDGRRRAARDDRRPDPGDRPGSARAPRAPVLGVPRVVDPPTWGELHGGGSRGAPRVSRLPASPRHAARRRRLTPGRALAASRVRARQARASAAGRSCGSWLRRPRAGPARGPWARGSRSAPCRASRRRSRD